MGCCEAGSSVAPAEGEKQAYDPNFQGPLRSRSCTDCLFLLLFIASWAGMAAIAGLALRDGDPARYYYGADMWGLFVISVLLFFGRQSLVFFRCSVRSLISTRVCP
eukprot:m.869005 g.869005  ORF g.869005 m.869005 type:complete len:106 (+) comp59739_c0_seq50:2192-2509(+)